MRQCELLRVPRSTAYYHPAADVPDQDLAVMHLIDKIHVRDPFKGSRRITKDLQRDHGLSANRARQAPDVDDGHQRHLPEA